jgi:hypothetical protein
MNDSRPHGAPSRKDEHASSPVMVLTVAGGIGASPDCAKAPAAASSEVPSISTLSEVMRDLSTV